MRVFVAAHAPKPRMLVFGAIDFAAAVARVGRLPRLLRHRVRRPARLRHEDALPRRRRGRRQVAARLPPERGRRGAHRQPDRHRGADPRPEVRRAAARGGAAPAGRRLHRRHGSRRTHEDRLERLREAGLTDDELARLPHRSGSTSGRARPRRPPCRSRPRSSPCAGAARVSGSPPPRGRSTTTIPPTTPPPSDRKERSVRHARGRIALSIGAGQVRGRQRFQTAVASARTLPSKRSTAVDGHLRLVRRGDHGVQLHRVVQRRRPQVADVEPGRDVRRGRRPGSGRPAAALGLEHDGRGAVAVEDRADDAAVEVAEAVVVLGPRRERGRDAIGTRRRSGSSAAAGPCVGRPAAEAREVRVEPLLDARALVGVGCAVRAWGQRY